MRGREKEIVLGGREKDREGGDHVSFFGKGRQAGGFSWKRAKAEKQEWKKQV